MKAPQGAFLFGASFDTSCRALSMRDDQRMSAQLLLPGIDPPPRPLPRLRGTKAPRKAPLPHSLFFALLPDTQDAMAIAALGERMNSQHALKGAVVEAH